MMTLRVALVVLWAAIALDYAAYDGAAARAAGRVIDKAEFRAAPLPANKAESPPGRAGGGAPASGLSWKAPQEPHGPDAKP